MIDGASTNIPSFWSCQCVDCMIKSAIRPYRRPGWSRRWTGNVILKGSWKEGLRTHIFKMRISFFAALRTFLPSFFRNFLHVYIFMVVLSLALKISQNSSLKQKHGPSLGQEGRHVALNNSWIFGNTHDLTIWPRSYLSVTSEGLL